MGRPLSSQIWQGQVSRLVRSFLDQTRGCLGIFQTSKALFKGSCSNSRPKQPVDADIQSTHHRLILIKWQDPSSYHLPVSRQMDLSRFSPRIDCSGYFTPALCRATISSTISSPGVFASFMKWTGCSSRKLAARSDSMVLLLSKKEDAENK
jgi:hypothetical protein